MLSRPFIRQCFTVFLGLCALLLYSSPSWAQHTYIGIYHSNQSASSGVLYVSGTPGTSVTVDSRDGNVAQSFSIPVSGMETISIPNTQILTQYNIAVEQAFTIQSSAPLSAWFLNLSNGTADMTWLLESNALGIEYRVLSWPGLSGSPAQMSVTALEDNTSVTVTPASNLAGGIPAGTHLSITLQAGQSVLYEAAGTADLTGSTVQADKVVAVFSGSRCSNVPINAGYCDHLFTQLPPLSALGTEYVMAETLNTGTVGNLVRIVAHEDDTEVTVNSALVTTLNTGQYHDVTTAKDVHIETSKPVLIGQLLKGYSATGVAGNLGDPALTIITPLPMTLSSYDFVVPGGSMAFTENVLNLVLPSAALPSLELDGVPVNTTSARQIGSTDYWALNVSVTTTGTHTVAANAPFVATLSGFSSARSYHTTIGWAKAPPPPTPPVVHGTTPIPVSGLWNLLLTTCGVLALACATGKFSGHMRSAV